MKKKKIKTLSKVLLGIAFALALNPLTAYADVGSVTFGSEFYEYEQNENFPIGVYIEGDETIGPYYVELSYDYRRMNYIEGAEREEDGVIILEGTATGEQVRYMLQFEPLSGGEANIEIRYAKVMTAQNESEFKMEINQKAPIYIEGEDTVGVVPEIPRIGGGIALDGKRYYLLDSSKYTFEETDWEFQYEEGIFQEEEITFLTNKEKNAKFVYLVDEKDEFHLYAYCEEEEQLYSCEEFEQDGKTYYLTNAKVCSVWPQELTLDIVNGESVYFGVDAEGNSNFYQLISENKLAEWDIDAAKDSNQKTLTIYKYIWIVAGTLILIMAIVAIIRMLLNRRNKKEEDFVILNFNFEDEISGIEDELWEANDKENLAQQPVISVQDVTMKFRVSTSNASGIKEYIIQLLTRQVNFRELVALHHVSFDVFKGEVVGIIGTNGSGKSTILRIVSGVLKPTRGKVKVDTNKIQLLTLGTGFDMELTARENVYLNGAIIGLSKEFIDKHYQDIVDFAELEGFMEEKVKNFSSGMMARLGFAIATVGEVSEILILDEVLSVGDEFFRKKSLAKVKEMIHSGSTVLMVSHSTQTIIENCTKAVWIEKGKLMMVGEPKKVCAEYKKSQGKKI